MMFVPVRCDLCRLWLRVVVQGDVRVVQVERRHWVTHCQIAGSYRSPRACTELKRAVGALDSLDHAVAPHP